MAHRGLFWRGLSPGGHFLKLPIINGPQKLFLLTSVQDRGFNSFLENIIKPSVSKTKWTGLLFRTRALILLDFDLNIPFRARKVTGTFEERAPGSFLAISTSS